MPQVLYTLYSILFLHPLFDAEIEKDEHDGEDHQADGEWITVCPMKFGNMVEVHTIHTGDERWRKEDYVDNGENLDDFVLLDVNKTEEGVLQILETVERKAGVLDE